MRGIQSPDNIAQFISFLGSNPNMYSHPKHTMAQVLLYVIVAHDHNFCKDGPCTLEMLAGPLQMPAGPSHSRSCATDHSAICNKTI
jgi:hypothetical protein